MRVVPAWSARPATSYLQRPCGQIPLATPTGVSHSPEETASMADCLAGVQALADTLERLAG